uniref:Ig-like domain-containing protein n=1 Tax=Cyclopterus lumpus TaxID=8103 RepID=A0A8C2WRG4_CYCLU
RLKSWSLFVLCCKLFCICLFSTDLIQTAEVPQQVSLTLVELGGNVTLWCPVFREGYFYWYKQTLGHMIQTVATVTFTGQKLSLQLNNTRFKVTGGKTQYSLTIRNITKEDEATYFCLIGTAYGQSFVNVTFLAVKDRKQQRSFYVKQSPLTESVQPGDSVTLQCSLVSRNKEDRVQCPGEHSVHWFRSGSGESHPGFIHTHSDAQEERSCDFSLSKTIHNSSDTGTYYCAVATCGEILFGEGTQVDTRSKLEPVVIGLGVLLACCVTAIVLLIFYVNRRRVCEHCKGFLKALLSSAEASRAAGNPGKDKSTVAQSTDLVNMFLTLIPRVRTVTLF